MNINKELWMEKLEKVHRHWSKKVYTKLQRKLSNLMSSLKMRTEDKDGSRFDVTKDQLESKLFEAYGKPCPYCNRILKIGKKDGIVCDHIVPLSAHGDSVIENLQFICSICNTRKDVLSHEDFCALLSWLNTQSDALRLHVLGKLSKKRF
jgi:5-methylcytosine-specific restriction endonuclease McrA